MQILSHSRNTHTVYNAYTYTHTVTRAYCKLQKLLPLAKLISKYASWHLMPSVTEIRAKDPAGGLKFLMSDVISQAPVSFWEPDQGYRILLVQAGLLIIKLSFPFLSFPGLFLSFPRFFDIALR